MGDTIPADEEFTAFVAVNYGRLLHIADLIVGDRARAEDLVQAVLIRTYLRWPSVRQGNPLAYVRTGLVNARTLHIAPGTVKSTCARALAKLRISPELGEPAVVTRPRIAEEC